MAHYSIKTPDIGEGIAQVELVAWHVKVGDTVVMDQIVADVMTDKATVEVPSPVAGSVLALGGAVGETLAVGSELLRLDTAGAGTGAAAGAASSGATPSAAIPAVPATPAAPTPAPVATAPSAIVQPLAAPARPAPVASANPAPRHTPSPAAPLAVGSLGDDRPIASPAVRRRAWEAGIDLRHVAPSGSAGRILHADLDTYLAQHPASLTRAPAPQMPKAPPTQAAPAAALSANAKPQAVVDREERIPVVGLRRKIATRMQDAKRRIAHFTYVEEVDVTEIETLRQRLNADGSARPRLTLLPFLVRALVLGTASFPQMNARFDDEAGVITRHLAVHVGIATQTDNGLLVPVLRNAGGHDLWSAAEEIARLAQAARAGRATREELSGSTLTITSLGALGGIVTTPVINSPEVAIIGVNRIVERPMVVAGAIVVRKMMNLSSSFDHRVVDGMDAARFVQALRGYLECPATLFV